MSNLRRRKRSFSEQANIRGVNDDDEHPSPRRTFQEGGRRRRLSTIPVNTTDTSSASNNLTEAVLLAIQGKKLHEVADAFQRGRIPLSDYYPNQHAYISAKPPWEEYPTTFGFILLLYIVYFYQFNARKNMKQVLTSYHRVVRRKRFHQLCLASLSHPPFPPTYSFTLSNISTNTTSLFDDGNNNYGLYLRQRALQSLQSSIAACRGPWAGFLLLVYNSHILWTVRALETTINEGHGSSSLAYLRTLIALTSCCHILELALYHRVVRVLDRMPSMVTMFRTNMVTKRLFLHISIGTCTGTTTALAVIFNHTYPQVFLPILPWLRYYHPWLIFSDWSLLWILIALCVLATNAKTGLLKCLCGFWVGFWWATGWISFLADAYWGSWWILWLVLATVLSCKASVVGRDVIPCIDSVAWNERGRIQGAPVRLYYVVTDDGGVRLLEAGEYEGESDDENAMVAAPTFQREAVATANAFMEDFGEDDEFDDDDDVMEANSMEADHDDYADEEEDEGIYYANEEDDDMEDVELNRLIIRPTDNQGGMRSRNQRFG
jgi:hypothetical protein